MGFRIKAGAALAAMALSLSAMSMAGAQDYPQRAITIIVPLAPGGATDVHTRALADPLRDELGVDMIVENMPGAGATLGATTVAKAEPDGYTLMVVVSPVFRQPHIIDTPFDPSKDFTYIGSTTSFSYGVAVRSDAEWKSMNELVEYARAHPGELTFGSSSAGSNTSLLMEELASREGISWTHLPAKGTSENSAALLGGHVNFVADGSGFAPLVDSGDFRLLASLGETRIPRWPDVPTLKEQGYDLAIKSLSGIAGPAGMDPAVVQKLSDAIKVAIESDKVAQIQNQLAQGNFFLGPQEYTAYAMEQIELEGQLVEKLGLSQK